MGYSLEFIFKIIFFRVTVVRRQNSFTHFKNLHFNCLKNKSKVASGEFEK